MPKIFVAKFNQDLAENSCRKVEEKAINLFQIEDLAISRPDVGRKMKKIVAWFV